MVFSSLEAPAHMALCLEILLVSVQQRRKTTYMEKEPVARSPGNQDVM